MVEVGSGDLCDLCPCEPSWHPCRTYLLRVPAFCLQFKESDHKLAEAKANFHKAEMEFQVIRFG